MGNTMTGDLDADVRGQREVQRLGMRRPRRSGEHGGGEGNGIHASSGLDEPWATGSVRPGPSSLTRFQTILVGFPCHEFLEQHRPIACFLWVKLLTLECLLFHVSLSSK
uniref:Uncharacterized protein n=1 Tax=Arundo donax TaxID=35708 RepID=A0A0A8XQ82_ARUDO